MTKTWKYFVEKYRYNFSFDSKRDERNKQGFSSENLLKKSEILDQNLCVFGD